MAAGSAYPGSPVISSCRVGSGRSCGCRICGGKEGESKWMGLVDEVGVVFDALIVIVNLLMTLILMVLIVMV